MERLTKRTSGGDYCPTKGTNKHQRIQRLAAYEDILYAPDGTQRITLKRLSELVTAEQDGRCVVLPCWGHVFIHSDGHVQEMEMCHYRGNTMGVYDMRCECINQEEDCDLLCGFENGDACAYNFRIAELGRTVFLTRAAAEAALANQAGTGKCGEVVAGTGKCGPIHTGTGE